MKPTPRGWPRISASIYYSDAAQAIDWLCRAFGFEVRLRVDGEAGRVEHSELIYAGGLVMVGQAGRKPEFVAPADVGGANTQNLLVYVDDLDAHCARARAAGATIASEPEVKDHGEMYWADRTYECVDPGGHHWWFSQRVRDGAGFAPKLDGGDALGAPPKGWPRISSAMYYADPARAIDWLGRALGFELQIKVEGEDGGIVHSELVFGGGLIMVNDEARDRAKAAYRQSPRAVGGRNTQALMVIVDDCKAAYERARVAGATITSEPAVSDYGEDYWADLSCGIEDVGGHHWWITQRVRG